MVTELKKFGTTLISRPTGRESFAALQPLLGNLKETEAIEIDFDGVITFSPAWGDEFLTPLGTLYNKRIRLKNTGNASVRATLELLEKIERFRVY
jgi:hypothetical protein